MTAKAPRKITDKQRAEVNKVPIPPPPPPKK